MIGRNGNRTRGSLEVENGGNTKVSPLVKEHTGSWIPADIQREG